MECDKEEAARAKNLAEEKMRAGDFLGAHKFVTKSQRLFPNLGIMLPPCSKKETRERETTGAATLTPDISDSDKDHAGRKRRKTVEEFTKRPEVDGAKTDANECYKRMKLDNEFFKQLEKKMDEIEKRLDDGLKQQYEFNHRLKTNLMKAMPVKPDFSDIKVQELAILWKGKIRTETRRSASLEVLAFLHFIVAYRLQNSIINQEETAQLASSIAHCKQAPTLFQSLGLNHLVPEFVKELIKTRQYIPAVRLVCYYKLKGFSPLHLLQLEIISLRIKTQAEEKDGGKLREILEIMADYKLEIDIPGELYVKLIGLGVGKPERS